MQNPRATMIAFILAIMSLPLSVGQLLADPPPGDTCASPIPLQFGVDWSTNGDLGPYANDYDAGLPGPSCTGTVTPGKDAVFTIEVRCGEAVSAYLDPVDFDGALYTVTDCADIAGSCIDGSDRPGVGVAEYAGIVSSTSRTYYIIVDAHDAGAGGVFHLSLSFEFWDIPPGACCFSDGHCEITGVDYCVGVGGHTPGPCSICESSRCTPVPAPGRSWGSIKARYR